MCNLNDFVKDNSAFLLTYTGILIYMLKSRCTRIRCGCISLERQPVSETQINQVTVITDDSGTISRPWVTACAYAAPRWPHG